MMDKLLPVFVMFYIYAAVAIVLIMTLRYFEVDWSAEREFLVHLCGISAGTIVGLLVI